MLGDLLLDTRDALDHAFPDGSGGFTSGRFIVLDELSEYETRIRGEDTQIWFSVSAHWPKSQATGARAVLGSSTISSMQELRVMYQVRDDAGNTRVSVSGQSRVFYDVNRSIACNEPDASSGIGECHGLLDSSLFSAPASLSLSLHTYNDIHVADFAVVSLAADPQWHQVGGWDGSGLPEAIFGAVLPFHDVYIAGGMPPPVASLHVSVFLGTAWWPSRWLCGPPPALHTPCSSSDRRATCVHAV